MKKKMNSKKRTITILAVCFFTAVLLLTFFSNTIMNASLPEITAQYVKSGRIYDRISGTGIASADDVINIYPECTGTIADLAVSTGDRVEQGELLCTIQPETDGTEDTSGGDKRKAYYAAIQLYLRKGLTYEESEIALEQDKSILMEEICTAYQLTSSSDTVYLSAAVQAEYTFLQNDLSYVNTDDFEKLPSKYQPEIQMALSSYESAQDAEEQARKNYSKAQSSLIGDSDTLQELADEAYRTRESAYEDYLTAHNAWQSAVNSGNENAAPMESAAESAWSYYESTADAYDKAVSQVNKAVQAENDASYAEQAYETAQESTEYASENLSTTLDEAASDIKRDISLLEILLLETSASDETLLLNEDGTVSLYAETSGIVTGLSAAAGDMVLTSAPVLQLIKSDSTYTVRFNTSAEKAQSLRPGIEASVINADAEAILKGVYNATSSSSGSADEKTLLFTVSGDVTAGQSLALKMSENNQSFDFTVPSRAISEDSTGTFILVLETKSTPLGNRYYAKKINVTVLADDGSNAAIDGEITRDTYVIVLCTEAIQDGDMVRMKESAE
ncbi:MAG: HlyD family efflux transporter periplasmic adaptor subunit [Ruminococcus sp.]|nr:HlyD family efflux transporter periplasmic adaptor subunit [Ruminococcus sp.]